MLAQGERAAAPAARDAAPAGDAGSQPTIVFSHANGFPAGTYRVLFDAWRAAGYRVVAVEKFGHDPRFPVSSNWPHLRDQLIECIANDARRPSFLVGHSLGGYLSLLAASRRPDLVRGVLLLDSPILGGLVSQTMRFAKATGLVERFSPGHVSRRRREHWPSAEAAYAHFAAKPAFARWSSDVLRDYIACGVRPSAGADDEAVDPRRPVELAPHRRFVERPRERTRGARDDRSVGETQVDEGVESGLAVAAREERRAVGE